jgi:hypothetical protein
MWDHKPACVEELSSNTRVCIILLSEGMMCSEEEAQNLIPELVSEACLHMYADVRADDEDGGKSGEGRANEDED